jgi:hypothetical protein
MGRFLVFVIAAVPGLTFLQAVQAAPDDPIVAKAPAFDRVASASKTALEVRDATTRELVWQAKFEDIKTSQLSWVTDGRGGRRVRPNYTVRPGITNDIRALAWSPDGKQLALADQAGFVMFDANDGHALWLHETLPNVKGLTFSSDGKIVVIKAPGGEQTFDAMTGKRLK